MDLHMGPAKPGSIGLTGGAWLPAVIPAELLGESRTIRQGRLVRARYTEDEEAAREGGIEMFRLGVALLAAVLFGGSAMAYDQALASTYERAFASFDEQQTAKSLQLMLPEQVMEALKKGEPLVFLDVRTEREQSIIGIAQPNALHIPMNKVFTRDGLAMIPTDKKVVVTCQSGARALAVSIALRDLGFENIYCLKGGLIGLSTYLDPKTAF
jgi:rhodanese-related sulfurtransferase